MDTMKRLFSYRKRSKESHLAQFRRALALFNHPEKSFPVVLVGGTNGKGTCVAKLSAAFSKKYRVGIFTSPHLIDYKERIQISGEIISAPKCEATIQSIFDIDDVHSLGLSFFQISTLAALLYFREQNVDFAFLEVGIGGELDATNVTEPFLSVITSIGFDHKEWLGDTLEQIAESKAGILRSNSPAVIGASANQRSIYDRASQLNCRIITVKEQYPIELQNREIASAAIQEIHRIFPIEREDLERGLKASAPGRLDIRDPFIFDTAHNPDAFRELVRTLTTLFPGEKFDLLTSFARDKDCVNCLRSFKPILNDLFHVDLESGLIPELPFRRACHSVGISNCTWISSLDQYLRIRKKDPSKRRVVIAGSFILLGAAYSSLEISPISTNISSICSRDK